MKISIITVAFNSAKTIEQTIRSVIRQTYYNIEYIIIDGGSSDETKDIVNQYKDKITIFVSEPDKGIYDAMNKGIRMATGDIIGMLNSDDLFYDTNILQLVADAFQNNAIDCLFGNLVFFDGSEKIVRKWHSKPFVKGSFSRSWTPAHPSFYCKKEIYVKHGLYKTDYKIAADVELMLRFLEVKKVRSFFLNEYLVKMLTGGVSTNGIKSTITITREMQRAFHENGLPINLLKYLFYKGLKLKEFIV